MDNPRRSDSSTTSCLVGLEILPKRSMKSIAVNHSSPVSRTSRAKSCRCCTRLTNSSRKRSSLEVSKLRCTASVIVCSVRLLDMSLPFSRVDHYAAGDAVGDGLVCRGRLAQGIAGGDGKRLKLAGFEVAAHFLQAMGGVDDAEFGAVDAQNAGFVVIEGPDIDADRLGANGADHH